ncbi:MAG: UDP-N-acetylglucosamine 1-carboxyvinyltransferase [Oscillospiraceae bacterium]|nr:UDP-N-acetylglucosamine 1-carboxyvinyltransferase [Oscillospiraceae bacterium]
MASLIINGGRRLCGAVDVQGAKNSALPIMAASLLVRGETVLQNCPDISDVDAAMRILRHLGCTAERIGSTLYLDTGQMTGCRIPDGLMREMRSSVVFLGAILARTGEAVLSLPGGCELGPRPIDLHLSALRALGMEIAESGGSIVCKAREPRGCRIDLAIPSVGATENSMLAAFSCVGETVITNAAREPEICDLARYLRAAGAEICGEGTSVITVRRGRPSGRVLHTVIPDRIAAATYLSAVASAGGAGEIRNICPEHIRPVTDALERMGCRIRKEPTAVSILAEGRLCSAGTVTTAPYPGFPTDAQPPLMAACIKCCGMTVFVETMFENRFRHAGELRRMGADIRKEGRVAIVTGVPMLHGAPVEASDLRGGAALAVAALGAEGKSEITGLQHVLRGYEDIASDLRKLGAEIYER